jgi:hypothetical protein
MHLLPGSSRAFSVFAVSTVLFRDFAVFPMLSVTAALTTNWS